jgi:hypothetical protein
VQVAGDAVAVLVDDQALVLATCLGQHQGDGRLGGEGLRQLEGVRTEHRRPGPAQQREGAQHPGRRPQRQHDDRAEHLALGAPFLRGQVEVVLGHDLARDEGALDHRPLRRGHPDHPAHHLRVAHPERRVRTHRPARGLPRRLGRELLDARGVGDLDDQLAGRRGQCHERHVGLGERACALRHELEHLAGVGAGEHRVVDLGHRPLPALARRGAAVEPGVLDRHPAAASAMTVRSSSVLNDPPSRFSVR